MTAPACLKNLTALLVLTLSVSACVGPQKITPETPPATEAPAQSAPPQTIVEPEAQPQTKPVAARPKAPLDDLANLPPVRMQPPERVIGNGLQGLKDPGPGDLIGLAAVDIDRMFGQPDFKRHDPPAEIWQYKKSGCVLDIFLYKQAGGSRVTHVEARGYNIKKVSGPDCLLETLVR